MNVVHPVALLVLDDAVEHADHGGEADAAREENDGAVGRSVEVERAARSVASAVGLGSDNVYARNAGALAIKASSHS